MRRLVVATLFVLTMVPTLASALVLPPNPNPATPNCKSETTQVQTQHNVRGDSAEAVLKNYEAEKAQIQEFAKKAGVTAIVKSENYNINAQNDFQYRNGNASFALNGNSSYTIEPKEKARNFFLLLTSNNIRGNLGYNMNNNCRS